LRWLDSVRWPLSVRIYASQECVWLIAALTGHTPRDVRAILDAHYLHRGPELAESAARKLETGTKLSKTSTGAQQAEAKTNHGVRRSFRGPARSMDPAVASAAIAIASSFHFTTARARYR
jgi:plasmid stabilization system protein ParE